MNISDHDDMAGKINTNQIRKYWCKSGVVGDFRHVILDLCLEIDRLRAKYETPKCSHCGHPSEKLHSITIEIDETAHGGQRERFEGICDLCLGFACKAMGKQEEPDES